MKRNEEWDKKRGYKRKTNEGRMKEKLKENKKEEMKEYMW